MVCEQQIEKLKGHTQLLVDELESIIQCFELVHPTIGDKDTINEYIGKKRNLGFRIIRRSVVRYCILGVTRLTYDREGKNPTAGRLIASLTRDCADRLREELKVAFARYMAPGKVPGHLPSALDIPSSEEIVSEVAEKQQIFVDNISQLKDRWQWFSEHETTFKDFRDKR